MSTSRDIEKGEPDEEDRALLRARNEGRKDDEEHLNRANNIVLADFEKPGPSFSNIANSDVKTEEPNQLQEPDLSEGSIKCEKINKSEESIDEVKEPCDQNFFLLEAIYKYKNEELIRFANAKEKLKLSSAPLNAGKHWDIWLENIEVPMACPIPILTAACQAQSNDEALRILLDFSAVKSTDDKLSITPLHLAALLNEPKSIAKILGFPEGSVTEETYPFYDGSRTDNLLVAVAKIPVGYTALHVASACAHSRVVRVLLKAGANPNRRDMLNFTPLDVAGKMSFDDNVQSYVETLQLLLEYGGSLSRFESLVLEEALRKRSLQALTLLLDAGASFDPRNPSDYILMLRCVQCRLPEHLEALLTYHSSPEMDYRAVDVTDEQGHTVLHWAASEGWADGVKVALLAGADITAMNSVDDTALHLAAKAGDFDTVKQILDRDTNGECIYLKKNFEGDSPFSNAILFSGNADIVKYMCDPNQHMKMHLNTKLGRFTAREYFRKLDYALAEKQKYITCILHEAIKHSSRDIIIVLLREGVDLSRRNKDGQTAMSLLMYHMTKPTELMSEVLDGCIESSADHNVYDKDCVITINYSVLRPENKYFEESECEDNFCNDDDNNYHLKMKPNDMKVLEALIETGDEYDQRSLLTHPVVESFLYIKWKKCAVYIYFLITAYVFFLISLNIFIAALYYHVDHKIKEQDIHSLFNIWAWRMTTAVCTFLFFCLVVYFFWLSSKPKWPCNKMIWLELLSSITKYRWNNTIWLKLFSSLTKRRCNKTVWLKLLLIVGGVIIICTPMDAADSDIIRGVAVITVSLSWIYLMILLSWTPTLGYYMQMYGKVSRNVIKVMLSFSFPLVGFSISFMILLHSKKPFDGPIAAFLKTVVMMSSEFEYEDLVKTTTNDFPKDLKNSTLDSFQDAPLTSVFMLRIFFLLFLICVAIVLMNLMLGVAVSDIQELSHDGKQRHLMKQIECIAALEKLFQRRPFSWFKWTILESWEVFPELYVTTDTKIFSKEIKESILNKAQSLQETKEKKADDVSMKAKIDEIFELVKKQLDLENELSEMRKLLKHNSEAVEKRIVEAVDKILKAIANDKQRTDLDLGQQK